MDPHPAVLPPLIIEVRGNELMDRRRAPNIPLLPDEIAIDAVACAKAGAATYHWHARTKDGEAVDDPHAYSAAAKAIREASDIILRPTLGFDRSSAEARISHVIEMKRTNDRFVDLVGVDNFTANAEVWDAEARRFHNADAVYANTPDHVAQVIGKLASAGIPVTLGCTDIRSIQTGMRFREMGILQGPVRWDFAASGGAVELLGGPNLPILATMAKMIRPGDSWSVLFFGGDILAAAGTIIAMGGDIAIGLGDYPYSRFGTPTNALLVEKLRHLAEIVGRPVATPEQARTILNLRSAGEHADTP